MDSKELKKILAGISVAALLGSVSLTAGCAGKASA
jgi:radical SAM modification target selenobiotic family peptide